MSNASKETLYHAIFLAQHLSRGDLKDGLVYILLELRMPPHLIGYHYVKYGTLFFYKDPVHTLLNGIYQVIIEKLNHDANCEQVESAMRSAINQAYDNCDPEVWGYYFQAKRNRKLKRPANLEFITHIAAFLELWQACCKEVSYEM